MTEVRYKEVNVTQIVWVATNEFRWVVAHNNKETLQQKWDNKSNGESEWRDINKVTL